MAWTKRLKKGEQYRFPVNNFCAYIPNTLSDEEIERCELLVLIFKQLETYSHELFHVLFSRLGNGVIGLIETVIQEMRSNAPGNLFESPDHISLLNHVKRAITQDESLLSRIPFVEDLIALQIRKAESRHRRQGRSADQTKTMSLNLSYVSVHDHDYLNLSNFLQRLTREDPDGLKPEKTAFVFLEDDILSMPYATYDITLKEFEKGISLGEYYALMDKKKVFSRSYHEQLTEKMLHSDVLA
jgi:hypothetical protein